MKQYALISLLLVALLVTACGKDDKKKDNSNNTDEESSATVAVSQSPRGRGAPQADDPYLFEAPISVGEFVRDGMRGNPTAAQSGGLEATYRQGDNEVVLTMYYFDHTTEASDTARYILQSSTITSIIGEPYYSGMAVYGVAQDRYGSYIAVWSFDKWAYMARTTSGQDTLDAFMQEFPY
jgi:hypothetical protein